MLIATWIGYTVCGVLVFSLAFLWAVRARQFWNQDRARYLPLGDEAPAELDPRVARMPVSALAPILIATAALALVIVTVVMSVTHR